MILFTHLAPEYFYKMIGQYKLRDVRGVDVYNLTSLDIRYPRLDILMPNPEFMSQVALQDDSGELFEQEYFRYLDSDMVFPVLIPILINEFEKGASHLTIIEISRSPYRDSIVMSLQKYLYLKFGIKAILFSDLEDWDDVDPKNSIFSIDGLFLMDQIVDYLGQQFTNVAVNQGGQ